ncbi:hypothetical protein [Flectobacillus roseus]|uniref:Uncharacterized protein n=1 Tax=Flectobacillus roseus TaxID=502259 RepID=A0ABT6Y6H6_9BACT|nr:hypothetical protein [Flectobacillus roseus]MDI9859131.1 hypothetical protein [Flectobacillus roseus]
MKNCILLLVFLLTSTLAIAQGKVEYKNFPPEKVLIKVDKRTYVAGETLHFSASVYDASSLNPSAMSVPLYVDFIEPNSGTILKKWILKLKDGKAQFDYKIDVNLLTGVYGIRAYTNWSKNFTIPFLKFDVLGLYYDKELVKIKVDTIVKFYQQPIAKVWNRVPFEVKDNFGKPIKATTYLVNSANDTILVSQTNQLGVGIIELNPSLHDQFQLKIGSKTLSFPQAIVEGSQLLIDKEDSTNTLRIRVQDTHIIKDTLTLLIHQRGKMINRLKIFPQKNSTKINLEVKDLEAGIINFSLMNKSSEVISQSMYYNDKLLLDSLQKELLLDSEIGESISNASVEDINRKLLISENKIYKTWKSSHKFAPPQQSIEVSGKLDLPRKVNLKQVKVLLLLEYPDSTLSKVSGVHIGSVEKDGTFYFSDLDFYDPGISTISAEVYNYKIPLTLNQEISEPFQATENLIDWRLYLTPKAQEEIEKIRIVSYEEFRHMNMQQSKLLEEVTIKAKRDPKPMPMGLFSVEPAVMIDLTRRFWGNSFWNNQYYRVYVIPRLWQCTPTCVMKYYFDGMEIPLDNVGDINMFTIQRIDIYDTAQAAAFGANIVISFVSKGGTGGYRPSFSQFNRKNRYVLQGYYKAEK